MSISMWIRTDLWMAADKPVMRRVGGWNLTRDNSVCLWNGFLIEINGCYF